MYLGKYYIINIGFISKTLNFPSYFVLLLFHNRELKYKTIVSYIDVWIQFDILQHIILALFSYVWKRKKTDIT